MQSCVFLCCSVFVTLGQSAFNAKQVAAIVMKVDTISRDPASGSDQIRLWRKEYFACFNPKLSSDQKAMPDRTNSGP